MVLFGTIGVHETTAAPRSANGLQMRGVLKQSPSRKANRDAEILGHYPRSETMSPPQ